MLDLGNPKVYICLIGGNPKKKEDDKMAKNDMTVTLKLKRIEVCDLLLACTCVSDAAPGSKKWDELHDKLEKILDDFDAKH